MSDELNEFFHDFRQEMLAGVSAHSRFQLGEFMEAVSNELIDTGFIEGFEFCHYRAQRGLRVDGYWFNDDDMLDLFVADFDSRTKLETLTVTEVNAAIKRIVNFFDASIKKSLYENLEETSPEYGLSREISDRAGKIAKVNIYLVSERALSGRLQAIEDNVICGIPATYHIWDISRLYRQRSSRAHKEILEIDFREFSGEGIPCLRAHLGSESYPSYLMVIPGEILAKLYENHGARLLEQNVRCFLQARGNVNKGIRATIINEPENFFAYNNGITATASEVITNKTKERLEIVHIKDLQIVNGGQTTASLYHTRRKDKASLDNIFIQMKLTVIDSNSIEEIVPRISEYANTQNRVNAADFFSNHPFHIRMEEFSRRIWAPPQHGSQRETKWFYERARGQYADAQSAMTPAEQKRFKVSHPKPQMFTKTDLAKFENVWDEHPRWVNLGAQKNFAKYAERIGKEWESSAESFNEYYFKRAIARGIIFRKTEKLVSAQSWYSGGYRANIVAYSIAALADCCRLMKMSPDFMHIWQQQWVSEELSDALVLIAKFVHDDIMSPPQGISNISEWCKKESCWERIRSKTEILSNKLPKKFLETLISEGEIRGRKKAYKNIQIMDDGIQAQKKVCEIPAKKMEVDTG